MAFVDASVPNAGFSSAFPRRLAREYCRFGGETQNKWTRESLPSCHRLTRNGKSSFIQALDEVLKHPATPNDLRAYGLAEDRSYIQTGKEKFLAVTFQPEPSGQLEEHGC